MFGLFIEREGGVAVYTPYPTALEAYRARMEYVAAAKRNGFSVRARRVATFLHNGPVRLEVWVARLNTEVA